MSAVPRIGCYRNVVFTVLASLAFATLARYATFVSFSSNFIDEKSTLSDEGAGAASRDGRGSKGSQQRQQR